MNYRFSDNNYQSWTPKSVISNYHFFLKILSTFSQNYRCPPKRLSTSSKEYGSWIRKLSDSCREYEIQIKILSDSFREYGRWDWPFDPPSKLAYDSSYPHNWEASNISIFAKYWGARCTCKARPMFAPDLCPNTQWGRQCRQQVLFESGLNLY